ncbi:general substrate transporter [Penicillium malachiteum]|uniref:general substrate transporter n=1 Tax=Penicillium malachiteum TaxID=1324776 RepID=UPI002546BAFB|nr:general substrate transporter [Penicillium malachiteum]KAJ5736370.1 general substrate transporter [Penicillium malachiteum]
MGMIALTGAALARARYFPEIDTSNTTGAVKAENARAQGTVVAIYTIGCLIGALGITQIGNRFGRRKSLIVAAVIAAIGQILQSSSFSIGQLVVGRIISGIGNGGVNAVVPVWQSECTASKNRGKNVVIIGVFISSGVAAAGWVNVGFSFMSSNEIAWRFPLALPILFTLMIMGFTSLFPESPRWLISKGRLEEAHVAMQKLSREAIIDDAQIRMEIDNIASLFQQSSQSERGFLDLVRPGDQRLFYRMCLAVDINFGAQMTGANVISYYGSTIFEDSLGLASKKAALLDAGALTWKIFAAISVYLSVDRFGRKPLFIIACLGMGFSMASLSGSIGTATHWLFNFVIAEITPVAFVTIKWRYCIVYAVISVSAAAMVYIFFPETNCRSLEEMDELFSDPDHWWQVPSYARALRTERPDPSPTKTSISHIEKV